MYSIEYERGHYVVKDSKGRFVQTADTYREAVEDVKELEQENNKKSK